MLVCLCLDNQALAQAIADELRRAGVAGQVQDRPLAVAEAVLVQDRYASGDTAEVRFAELRRLRQKLGDDPDRPRYIQTEWGTGYRFLPPR